MRNIAVFYLQRVALHFKAMPNSIGFYKRIFLRTIPVRIVSSNDLIAPKITTTELLINMSIMYRKEMYLTFLACLMMKNKKSPQSVDYKDIIIDKKGTIKIYVLTSLYLCHFETDTDFCESPIT